MTVILLVLALLQDQLPREVVERERNRGRFDRDYRKLVVKLADDHVSLGKYFAGARLHAWGLLHFKQAVALDPDNTKARKRLGFRNEGGEWVRDPGIIVKEKNVRKGKLDRFEKELETRGKKLSTEAIKGFKRIASWCRSKKLPEEEKICYRHVLQYNREDAEALKALGHTKEGERWVSPELIGLRQWFKNGLEGRTGGKAATTRSQVEEKLGFRMRKRSSEHFFIESSHLPDATLVEMVRLLEQTWALYHQLFGLTGPAVDEPIRVVLFKTQAEHNAFIDAFETGTTAEKMQSKQSEGWMYVGPPISEVVQRDKPLAFLMDYIIHSTCHILLAYHIGEYRPWLLEGLATYFTYQLKASVLSACFNMEGTSREGGKDFSDPEHWPLLVREWMQKGGDPTMQGVLRSALNELDTPRMIKAWSLFEFLVIEHRADLKGVLEAMAADKGDAGGRSIQKVLGLDVDQLEAAWKAYARRAY